MNEVGRLLRLEFFWASWKESRLGLPRDKTLCTSCPLWLGEI